MHILVSMQEKLMMHNHLFLSTIRFSLYLPGETNESHNSGKIMMFNPPAKEKNQDVFKPATFFFFFFNNSLLKTMHIQDTPTK